MPGADLPAADLPEADLLAVSRLTSGPDLVHVRPSLPRRIAAWWVPRRVLAFAVLAPLVLWMLSSLPVSHPLPLLLLVSGGVALSLTTYVPLTGESLPTILGSPCSAFGGVLPMACAVATLGRSPGSGLIAIGFVAFGLYQRLGSASCGVR